MKRLLFATVCILALGQQVFCRDFEEKEMSIVAKDGLKMGATLTSPVSSKVKAALVLATGSGTQNRDEEIMGKKPFKTIAEFLSANGYVVLRADDRGYDDPEQAEKATIETFIDDINSAIDTIGSLYPDMPIGVLGHSSGGSYAITCATHNPKVDFIITLAAPAWAGDSIVISQSRAYAVAKTGKWDNEDTQKKIMYIAKSSVPDLIARVSITQVFNELMGDVANIPQAREQIQQQTSVVLSPWYRSMLRYDPAEDIPNVRVPWLALNGTKDTQVLPGNLTTIHELNPHASIRLMDNHNHLFLQCQSGLIDEYPTLPGDISDETLNAILQWLEEITI